MIETIEKEYRFAYPSLYRQLYQDQMLNWGLPDANWYAEKFPSLRAHPPLLLFAKDFEIMDFPLIQEELANIPKYWNPVHTFIPFAKSGAGDWYAFYPNLQENGDIPIVFVWHDSNETVVLAKNLQDFIFRSMLEAVNDLSDDALVCQGDFQQNLISMLTTHRPYLTARQAGIIEEVYQKPMKEYRYKLPKGREMAAEGILDNQELASLLKAETDFPHFNYSFPHQLDE